MRAADPWLSQGDVFAEVPVFRPVVAVDGTISAHLVPGVAVLLTQDCVLDKRSRGQSTVQRLSFAELRPASELAEAKREALMRGRIDPSEAFLVEDVDGEDFYGVLSQTFHLPAAYFGTQLRDFLSEPRLVATANDNRKGRLSDTERWLLNRKQSVFWGRLVPTEDLPLVAIDPAPDSEA